MKLLLINSVNTGNLSETVFPNLGLGYIASYLSKHIKDIEIKTANSNGNDARHLLKEMTPDLVGISSVSQNFDYAAYTARICKEFKIPVFMGGIHISSLPETLPLSCDIGIIGEGERTALDLVRSFLNGGLDTKSLYGIEGIIFRDPSGKLVKTAERKLIDNLDELPFPDRDLLRVEKRGFLHIFSSRGCGHRCIFCSNSRFWKNVRLFSAEYVFNELRESMDKFSPRAITFYDDDFLINKERLHKLSALIEKSGINRKTEFNLMARPDNIDEEIVSLLKRMNVTVVSLGLESGSQKVLDFLKCGTTSIEDNMKAVRLLNKAGILSYGFFIIGSPKETEADIRQTYNFIRESKLSGFSVYSLVPYPGTPIWDYALQRGLVSNSMSWGRLSLNIHEAKEPVIVMSEEIGPERLYSLYWDFQKLRRRKHITFMLHRAVRNPKLILPRFSRSILHRLGLIRLN